MATGDSHQRSRKDFATAADQAKKLDAQRMLRSNDRCKSYNVRRDNLIETAYAPANEEAGVVLNMIPKGQCQG